MDLQKLAAALPPLEHRNSLVPIATAQTQDEEELQRLNRFAPPSIKEINLESWRNKAGFYDKFAGSNHIALVEKGILAGNKNYPPVAPQESESPQEYVDRIFKVCTRRSFTAIIGLQQVFWAEVRKYIVSKVDVKGLPLVNAFRLAARSFVFPVESIEKERLIEALADEYHKQNPNVFEQALISRNIFFATMVCNTILWNKHARKLHNKQANLRCMFWDMLEKDDQDIRSKVSESLVLQIYADIKKRPIAGLSDADSDVDLSECSSFKVDSELLQCAMQDYQITFEHGQSLYTDKQLHLRANLWNDLAASEFDFQSTLDRAPIKSDGSQKLHSKESIATQQIWQHIVDQKNGIISKVNKLGFFFDSRSAQVAGGHSTLQSVDSGLIKSSTVSVRSRSVSPTKELLPIAPPDNLSRNSSSSVRVGLYTFRAPLLGNVGGHSMHMFDLQNSSIYHLYQDNNSCLSTSLFNIGLYMVALSKLPLIQNVLGPDCKFTSQSKVIQGNHILTDILHEDNILTAFQKWHSITNNESTADIPVVLFHGPLLKNGTFKLDSIAKLQFVKQWKGLHAVVTINRHGAQVRLYDDVTIGGLIDWIAAYRQIIVEEGLAVLRPSALNHLSFLADECKIQQLQKTATKLPPFPRAAKTMNLDGSLVFSDVNNWQNSDVLVYVQSDGSWFTQFLTPDKVGLHRPSPIAGTKLPQGDSGTKFAQNILQGVSLWQTSTQQMSKSGQQATDQFLLSEKSHWLFHLNLAAVASTVQRDIVILVSSCQNSWSGILGYVRKLCIKNMDNLHALAIQRNNERKCLSNGSITSLTFQDSPGLDAQDTLVIEKSTSFGELLKGSWQQIGFLASHCGFDDLLVDILSTVDSIVVLENQDSVPFYLHLVLMKLIMYQYSNQLKSAKIQVTQVTQKLNQVELSILAQDFAFDSDTFEPVAGRTGGSYAQSIRSRMTKLSSVSFQPGFRKPIYDTQSIKPSITTQAINKLKSYGTGKQRQGLLPTMPGHHHPQVAQMSIKSAKSQMSQMVKNIFGNRNQSCLLEAQKLEVQLDTARIMAEKYKIYTGHLARMITSLEAELV